MLKTLRIRNLAIIEDLTIDFGAGLNVLTGETGAGKSILVDAVGLAAGDRADSALVRSEAERAVVEAVFGLARGSAARELARERGWDAEGEDLIVRRDVASSGGRVFLNGSPATVAVLREVGDLLVELHGQHEHQSLLSSARHLELLDGFGGHAAPLAEVGRRHDAVIACRRRVEELRARAIERDARRETLERVIREIEAVAPRPGELDEIDRERQILRSAGRMAQLLEEAVGLLYEGEPTAASLAAGAARRLASLADLDPRLEETAARVESARVELEDAGAALRDYRDAADFDPRRLESLEARRAALETLLLRHGPDERAALRSCDEARRESESLDRLAEDGERAARELAEAESDYAKAAAVLSAARRRAAGRMRPRVEAQLRALAMARARFEVAILPSRGSEVVGTGGASVTLGPRGADRAEFLLCANPGEALHPLSKVASGGELARVMLGLHVVLDGAASGRVLVFDEIDAGVAGAVADAVGSRLAEISRRHQVLCVTHLPQVAAYADRHYHVGKRVAGQRTKVEVAELSRDERIGELARMLGGKAVTAAATRNAAELLAAAAEARRA